MAGWTRARATKRRPGRRYSADGAGAKDRAAAARAGAAVIEPPQAKRRRDSAVQLD